MLVSDNLNRSLIHKYLPNNFLAEKTILSSLLVSSEAIDITLRIIKIEAYVLTCNPFVLIDSYYSFGLIEVFFHLFIIAVMKAQHF